MLGSKEEFTHVVLIRSICMLKFKQLIMWTRAWLDFKLVGKKHQTVHLQSTWPLVPWSDLFYHPPSQALVVVPHSQARIVPHPQESSFSPQAIRDPSLYASDCSSTRPGKKDSPWSEDPVSSQSISSRVNYIFDSALKTDRNPSSPIVS